MKRRIAHGAVLPLVLLVVVGCPPAGPDAGADVDAGDEVVDDTVKFPADFQWGTAVAQWQVEGDARAGGGEPIDSNWRQFLEMDRALDNQRNPDGNGFGTRYEEDLDLAVSLGLKAFRMSVDWSRIEPEQGVYDDDELDHVVAILEAAHARGLEPVLTLWHWVMPVWVQNPNPAAPGGSVDMLSVRNGEIVAHFEAFVRHVLPRVKHVVDVYTVLNEPFSIISAGYMANTFPPGRIFPDVPAATSVGLNLVFMHAKAFDAIKELDDVDADNDGAASFVGLTQTANLFHQKTEGNTQEAFAIQSISYVFNDWYMIALTDGQLDVNLDQDATDTDTMPPEGHYPELEGRLEFVGVQYYGPVTVRQEALLNEFHPLYGYPMIDVEDFRPELPHNGMGREISAQGFRDTLEHYAQWGIPMLITENGTTTNLRPIEDGDGGVIDIPRSEEQAAMYLVEHLFEVGRAISRGLDIRAYYHWTLVDNFEWAEGSRQRFGAYTVDIDDPARPRTLTVMGQALKDIIDAGGITAEIWNRYVSDAYPSDLREVPGLTVSEPGHF